MLLTWNLITDSQIDGKLSSSSDLPMDVFGPWKEPVYF